MARVRVHGFSVSLDGYGAGPDQDRENPLGVGGMALHEWVFPARTFRQEVLGEDGGETGPDDAFAARGLENIGAWILGRNMFGPVRGAWPDESWKGWWGKNPPYRTDDCSHPPPARSDRDGRRHDVLLRHRWNSRGPRAGEDLCRRQGRPGRRRRQHRPAICLGQADRRDAHRGGAGGARKGRTSARRHRSETGWT